MFINCSLRVITFQSPPVVSSNLCDSHQVNILNIVFGADIISRLSFGSLLDLKFLAISIAKVKDKLDDFELSQYIKEVKAYLLQTDIHPKLYLPGKIYHILNEKVPIVKELNFRAFSDIIVDRFCFFDHSLTSLIKAFEKGAAK